MQGAGLAPGGRSSASPPQQEGGHSEKQPGKVKQQFHAEMRLRGKFLEPSVPKKASASQCDLSVRWRNMQERCLTAFLYECRETVGE